MNFERRIEVMRAHRTSIKRNPSENETPKPRPIHVYLLRYTDVSKTVRDERSKLRKDYLQEIKAKPGVVFAFIPWSVPAKILYKEDGTENLKSFFLPKV